MYNNYIYYVQWLPHGSVGIIVADSFEFLNKMTLELTSIHYATRKAAWSFKSWNPAGVEPVHWKPADINPGSLKWAKIGKYFSSELMVQIKQKKVRGV